MILKFIVLEVDNLKKPHVYEKYTKTKSKDVKMNADKYNFNETDYNQGMLITYTTFIQLKFNTKNEFYSVFFF